ncbi:hypothetical protein ABZ897_42930 [Nonomuraea sp. NPDC046802]|uniref:hypothetical protein n=1 Tax=Nonomuraea sp. NPDC046802 TaxID=3154919 RepID=UPI0033CB5874
MTFERFERALLAAYFKAVQADPTAAVLGGDGIYSHVLITPADSVFARWLVDQQIGVVTEAGEVALPYAGSFAQTRALAHALIVCLPDVVATTITSGSQPPITHGQALEALRTRYDLPAVINTADALPDQLTA